MKVTLATSLLARLRGLLGRTGFPGALLLAPCHDVHTFGMRAPIDIAFVDRYGTVLETHRDVDSHRRLRCRGAAATLERFSDASPWLEQGDQIQLVRQSKERKHHENLSDMQC